MLTAQKAFAGETIPDTLAAVLTRKIDPGHVPERVRPLLRRCLERDPKERLGWIGDARALLDARIRRLRPRAMGSSGGEPQPS